MAKTLVAAMWVVIVSASRYVDYANVKVSQYGNSEYDSPQDSLAADDYQDNSVDALAALDYKYEEDIRDDKGLLLRFILPTYQMRNQYILTHIVLLFVHGIAKIFVSFLGACVHGSIR